MVADGRAPETYVFYVVLILPDYHSVSELLIEKECFDFESDFESKKDWSENNLDPDENI